MEDVKATSGQEQTNESETVVNIGNDSVMQSAIDVLGIISKKNYITLKARGNSIPNAVAVANIITEKMMNGTSKVEKINLDTMEAAGIGRMTSTIEIILKKI